MMPCTSSNGMKTPALAIPVSIGHEGEDVGLYDTVLSANEFERSIAEVPLVNE